MLCVQAVNKGRHTSTIDPVVKKGTVMIMFFLDISPHGVSYL